MIFGKGKGKGQSAENDSSHTRYSSLQLTGEGLEREYEDIVRAQIARLGVPLDTVHVEVRPAGTRQDGRHIYLGMVRLTQWEPRTSLRLLVALPLLETKTRQSLETTWLMDVSHFGGLWIHASAALRSNEVLCEIREAVTRLELGAAPSAPRESSWSPSVQAELEDPEAIHSRQR